MAPGLQAQETKEDSLLMLLGQAKDKDKAEIYNELSEEVTSSSPGKGREYGFKALEQGQKFNLYEEVSEAYMNIAYSYLVKFKDKEANLYYLKAYRIKQKYNLKNEMPLLLNQMGLSYLYLSKYDSSGICFNNALELARELKDKKEEIRAYINLGTLEKSRDNYDKAMAIFEQALINSEEFGDLSMIARSLNEAGNLYKIMGDNNKAIELFEKCAKVNKELGKQQSVAINFFNIGNSYLNLSNYDKANEFLQKALVIFENIPFERGIRNCYIGLANVYENWAQNRRSNSYLQAYLYYKKAYEINKNLNDKTASAEILNNLGNLFGKRFADFLEQEKGHEWEEKINPGDHIKTTFDDSAIHYLEKTIELRKELKDESGLAISLVNLGTVYSYIGRYDQTKEYYLEAANINEKLGHEYELVTNYRALGRVASREDKLRQALDFYLKSLKLAKKTGYKEELQFVYEDMSKAYEKLGEYNKALDSYRKHTQYKDSVFSEKSQKVINELQVKYQTAKKEQELERQKTENERQKVENALQLSKIQQQKMAIILFICMFMLIGGFVFLLFRQNKKIKNVNVQLEQKNHLITEQKREITDSIHYASRIQHAILPPEEIIEKYIPDKFILFRPRDIVSGDFYFISERNGKIIVVAADCTGHGVPGAFMSMLGTAFLNEIISKSDELHADQILNLLRDNVVKSLHQTGKSGESQDGMDLALYILDPLRMELEYSGANNPLVIIRKGEILETKADKMPIGIHIRKDQPFTRHVIKVEKDDVIYTFSDGYQDQFGGTSGKKFMVKNLKKLLSEIYTKPMEEQKNILNKKLISWMDEGSTSQIDDVLLVGVKVI